MRVRVVSIILFVMLVLVGCSSPHQLPNAPTPIPRLIAATLPAGEAEPTALPEATETPGGTAEPSSVGDPDEGQQVFEANCAVCHNLSAEPKVGPGMAGLFADQVPLPNGQPFTEENLREWIRNGGGAMPGIPLGEAEMNDLIAFLGQETQ